mmetsp:Transcript_25131/g.22172  ORF Transcript_25131/g.22172 Transcript_25131/m.22172 type:complete len:133 (-) Transcript_25131:214-612(-)
MSDFAIKFQANPFKLEPESPEVVLGQIPPGGSEITRVPCTFDGKSNNEAPECPYIVQIAFKTSVDVFIFSVPCALSVMMVPTTPISTDEYQALGEKGFKKSQEKLEIETTTEKIKEKLNSNNVMFVGSRTNG